MTISEILSLDQACLVGDVEHSVGAQLLHRDEHVLKISTKTTNLQRLHTQLRLQRLT